MLRFLLLVLLGYIVWRFLRSLFSVVSQPQGARWQRQRKPGEGKPGPRQYVDIKDAEFEDITSEKDAETPK